MLNSLQMGGARRHFPPGALNSQGADLHKLIKRHPEVRWSAIARASMREYAKKLALLDELTATSRLSDQDVEEIGRTVKAAIRRRHEGLA